MTYDYRTERARIFTEEGQREFLELRDRVRGLLNQAGAFTMGKAFGSGETWFMMACVDRLVELEELAEVGAHPSRWGQHRVFVAGKKATP